VKNRLVSATEFKAKCLALFDEIDRKGGAITVTRRGRPVVTVGPVAKRLWKSSEGAWTGKVRIPQDRLTADTAELWDVVRGK
jgi:antitoxin (DNA-binding transcriptional repressor) of toxin-antitoxin stability system